MTHPEIQVTILHNSLQNHFNFSYYLIVQTKKIWTRRAVARGNNARLRPLGYGAAAFPRSASEGWEGVA